MITVALIAACVGGFLFQLTLSRSTLDRFIFEYGVVPRDLLDSVSDPITIPREALTLISSLFLHGGWLHLLGNLWYLWIFADNVEDRMGHARFLFFYLGAGIVASLVHAVFNWGAPAPAIGASGAIAGVLGAYLVAFPLARVLTLIPPLLLFVPFVELPAFIVLGSWFLMQLFNGTMSISHALEGGVAWWAHIGGFVFGLTVGPRLMQETDRALHRWEPRRREGGWMPRSKHIHRYRWGG